jgi:hypothetical protein
MYDKQKVTIGLAVFLVIVLFPIWFSIARGGSGEKADPVLPPRDRSTRCIAPTETMRATHMEILNDWRDSVVRRGRRLVKVEGLPGPDHGMWEMSLTRTCLSSDCHSNKSTFCDRCHTYADVTPYCWDCHVAPKEGE